MEVFENTLLWTGPEYSNLRASFKLCSRDSEFPSLDIFLDISKIVGNEISFYYKINGV